MNRYHRTELKLQLPGEIGSESIRWANTDPVKDQERRLSTPKCRVVKKSKATTRGFGAL